MRVWAGIVVLGIVGSLTTTAWPRDIYVSNAAGDDTYTGYESRPMAGEAGPVRTIQRALRLANPGDVIQLDNTGTPYRESISLVGQRHSGFPDQPFVIRGNGATLDGSRAIPPHAWEHFRLAIFRFRPIRSGYQQLFIDGRPAARMPIPSMDVIPDLKPLEWCMADGWIYFCVEPEKLPADYNLSCADLQTGITLYHVTHASICELYVQGFQTDGISAFNSARDVRIFAVTCQRNGRAGISVGGACSVAIENTLLCGNGMAQLLTLPLSQTRVARSVLSGDTAPGWVDQGGRFLLEGSPLKGGLDQHDPRGKQGEAPAAENPAAPAEGEVKP